MQDGRCLKERLPRTRRDPRATPAADPVERDFSATAPDRPWTADITYIRTKEGFLHLAFVLDVYSRRIVGWSMASHLRAELVVDALEMATWRRKPTASLVHHSDGGTQYTALSFGKRLEEADIVPSMGRTGSALDNAVSESFVATLKAELVHARRFPTRGATRSAVFEYLEAFYNRRRLHSSLGYVSPQGFEDLGAKEVAVA